MPFSKRQDQIIQAGIHLIAHHGIQNLTIKRLAAEVGVTEGAIYRHFESKQAILLGVLEQFRDHSSAALHEATQTLPDPIEQLKAFFMDRYRQFAGYPELAKVMFSEAAFQNQKQLAEKNRKIIHQHKEKLVHIIRCGQDTGRIRQDIDAIQLFRLLVGGLRLLVTQWCFSDFSFDLESQGRALWNASQTLITPSPKDASQAS